MTAITQLQIQTGLKTGLDAVSGFESLAQIEGDALLDDSVELLPYAMILTADNYDLTPAPGRIVGTFSIPVIMFFEFMTWQETDNAIRNLETAVIEYFYSNGSMWSAGGLSGVILRRISAQPIGGVYPMNAGEGALPVMLTRRLDFEVELF